MSRTRSLELAADGDLRVRRDPDRPSGRLLRQGDMDASYVDLADARHLEFDYLRWVRAILTVHRARTVVHLGGAACTLARALLAEDRASRQHVYEADARVIEFCRAHLGLCATPGLRVRVADGRAALAWHRDGSVDAIVIDAFVGARVPRHLVTAEAMTECARVASLTIVNVVDGPGWQEARAVAAALTSSYGTVGALAASQRAGNVVVFGYAGRERAALLQSRAAADVSAPRLFGAAELRGAVPSRD